MDDITDRTNPPVSREAFRGYIRDSEPVQLPVEDFLARLDSVPAPTMRRLILEIRSDEIRSPDSNVQSVELLHLLDATVEDYAAIWRVRPRKISRSRTERRQVRSATQREILGA